MSLKYLSVSAVVCGLLAGPCHVSGQTLQNVTLAWNASVSSNIVSYAVYWGVKSRVYSSATNVGNALSATVPGFQPGQTYYFAVTALNVLGMESLPSTEVSYQVPLTPNPNPAIVLTSPSSGQTFTAPASINCVASVVANGHLIGAVQFYNVSNGYVPIGQASAAPYQFIYYPSGTGSLSIAARLVYDKTNTLFSIPVAVMIMPPVPGPVTLPWQTCDVGPVASPGAATQLATTYTVTGAGIINGTADSFRYVYQPLTADGEIRARLNSVGTAGRAGRLGVMIRETLASNSKYALVGVSQDMKWRWQWRNTSGANTYSVTAGTASVPQPWVRLTRTGTTLTGYDSIDGVNWTMIGSHDISMATNILVGLVVASGKAGVLNTSVFDNVSVAP